MSMRLKFIPPYSHSVQLTKRWDHPATAGTPFSSRPPKLSFPPHWQWPFVWGIFLLSNNTSLGFLQWACKSAHRRFKRWVKWVSTQGRFKPPEVCRKSCYLSSLGADLLPKEVAASLILWLGLIAYQARSPQHSWVVGISRLGNFWDYSNIREKHLQQLQQGVLSCHCSLDPTSLRMWMANTDGSSNKLTI